MSETRKIVRKGMKIVDFSFNQGVHIFPSKLEVFVIFFMKVLWQTQQQLLEILFILFVDFF